jgi:membrane-associated phospholipid phosphatase
MDIYSCISLTNLAVMILPFGAYIISKKRLYIIIFICVFIVFFTTEIFKKIFSILQSNNKLFYSPVGSQNCGLFNQYSKPNSPAFPSSHMSIITFTSIVMMWFLFPNSSVAWIIVIGYMLLIGFSRYKKKCHNLFQIICGTIYGIFCAFIFIHLYIKLK